MSNDLPSFPSSESRARMPGTPADSSGRRVLVLARKSLGGIFVFCENVFRGAVQVDVLYYAEGERTGFDPASGTFVVNRFDPLTFVYARLKQHIDWSRYDVLVANEGFELGFFAWLAPRQPVCFIVHVCHQHSYEPAIRYAATIDHCFCVSETAAAYLQARGIPHASFFRYSTFIPPTPSVPKQRKIVYVGRFEPDKNISETIGLLRFFREQGYAVRMIGGGSLASRVQEALPPADVMIGAPREQIFRELSEAMFLCHNSYVEGLPIIHTEAIHFGLGIICNYVDKSIHEVAGQNCLLWSDRAELLQRMATFVFQTPPGPRRINHPELNARFLQQIREIHLQRPARRSVAPEKALDRAPPMTAAAIRSFRQWRWTRATSKI